MKKIRVTIVGCGAVIDHLYKRPLRKLDRQRILKVVGLVDKDQDRAKKIQKFFPKASIYENILDAISMSGSNLTIVASPAEYHFEHSIFALQNGSHVLCEKPMAITKEQCNKMIQTARDTRRLLAIGMTRRFFPSLAHLKNMITTGELGKYLSFNYREGGQYNWPVITSASFKRCKGGGGVLFDMGSHVLDSIIWLFGMPSSLSFFDDALVGGVEANCLIQMNAPSFNGFIHLSWDHNLANEFHITGSKAEVIIKLDNMSNLIIKNSDGYQKIVPQIAFPMTIGTRRTKLGIPKFYHECFYFQIVQMVRAIKLGESVPASGEEGKEVISLIEHCYKIAKPIDMTWLPPPQNETYKELHWKREH